MNTKNENGRSFKFSISNGDVYGTAPMLLGRDNPYTLNVKLIDKNGTPVSGVKYSISSTNDGEHRVVLDGMDRTYTSSESGNDFYLEGSVATEEAHLQLMQYAFSVECVTDEDADKVTGKQAIKMGRLLRWGRPGISVKTSPDKAVFTTKTERVGRESEARAKWNWGQKVDTCTIKIGDSIDGSGATSLTGNTDASFQATPEIDLSKFSSVSKANIHFEGGLSSDGFTAVLPYSEDNIDLYYFQSIAFSKPSVIVGVPAEVSCKLMGLDNKPRVNIDVEWATNLGSVLPTTSKTDAQGVAKTECTANEAGSATVTVLSKTQRMIKGTTAPVPVGPLLIADPTASAAQYVVGHSDAIKFSVTLKAGGQPVSGLTVEWFVGDTAKGTSTANDSGKATRELTFTAGQAVKQVVKARVAGTQVQTTFDINVYTAEITDPKATATEYVIGHSPDVTFSYVLKAGGAPLVNANVEWAIDGTKIKDGKTDSDGYASHTTSFGGVGDRQITVKDVRSGESHSFSLAVFDVKMTDPESSESEYVLKHSSPIRYSVVLEADGKPLAKKQVEWSVGGTTVILETDETGRSHFEKSFDAVGDYTINAKDARSAANHSFTTKVFAVEMTDPQPSAPNYVLGFSAPLQFSVVLKAGSKPLANAKVLWSVDGSASAITTTNGSGKAVRMLEFDREGTSTVTAKVVLSGEEKKFTVVVKYGFLILWSSYDREGEDIDLSAYPNHMFREVDYVSKVFVVGKDLKPVIGIPFSVSFDSGMIGEYVSSASGEVIEWKLPHATVFESKEVVFSGGRVGAWRKTYKLGWLYKPWIFRVSRNSDGTFTYRGDWEPVGGYRNDFPVDTVSGSFVVSTASGSWVHEFTEGYAFHEYMMVFESNAGPPHPVESEFVISEAEALDGYMVFLPGEYSRS